MHNRALHDTLAAFVEEAAQQLAAEVAGGAEVPFELMDESRAGRRGAGRAANFYCYRPLVGEFVAGRSGVLAQLPSHAAAVGQLAALPSPDGYLVARGERPPRGERRVVA